VKIISRSPIGAQTERDYSRPPGGFLPQKTACAKPSTLWRLSFLKKQI
jgi:hypothetical protein